jgi:hypothetical protein
MLVPLYALLTPSDGSLTLVSLNPMIFPSHLGGLGPDIGPFNLGSLIFMLLPFHALLKPSDGSLLLEFLTLIWFPFVFDEPSGVSQLMFFFH